MRCQAYKGKIKTATFLRNVENKTFFENEMESLMKRNIGAKALMDSSEFSLAAEDPLLQKFRDMGID